MPVLEDSLHASYPRENNWERTTEFNGRQRTVKNNWAPLVVITHDLRVATRICDLVAVMKDGEVVEHGRAGEVFGKPQHPYTQALLDSIPGGEFAREHDTAAV